MSCSRFIITLFILWSLNPAFGQGFEMSFTEAVNELRSGGCRCGGKYFKPVGAVKYNEQLAQSAAIHAQDIRRQRRLNHYSSNGLNIGQRVDRVGYRWAVVGENLAFGHESIQEVIRAWIDSNTHCRLLMDDRFRDIGLAKLGSYWVLHFGRHK
jgi:uncharacterized protein YkwD